MEKSQSSDCVPESEENFSMTHVSKMDCASYKSLITKTQEALRIKAKEELQVISIANLLQDCSTFIDLNLYVVTGLLSEAEVCISKVTEYLSDAVSLLELLSNFIRSHIGSELMTCCEMKTFPTLVGMIIVKVFSHCKDSELLYESNLRGVEKHLKDLFRHCHNLQLTYLEVLEEHFVFDLTDTEQKDVLLEALVINLKVGATVPSLDVKSMAVQWKIMTTIYEKYSGILSDTIIFQDCVAVLCPLIKSSINIDEANQDDKVIERSLKVANFLLKILLKVCDIFRHATTKEYKDVIFLLFYIHETSAHLQMTAERSRFKNLIQSPSECLLNNLLNDETFGHTLLDYDIENIKQEDNFLGYVLTITSVMDCLTQGHKNSTVTKSKLINCLYSILSECDSCNLDVTLWTENQNSHGLFEHLLIHSLALALTLNCEEYGLLENNMVEAILSTNHISALFSSNIWALLHIAGDINPQLLFNQIVWLCTMYKKLEKHTMFHRSPQKLQLSHTITRLFNLMRNDDKMKICKQFRVHDDDNLSLWAALGVNSLPLEAKSAAEAVAAEKLKAQFQCLSSNVGPEKIDKLIKVMSVASTCTFTKGSGIEDYIMKAWSKTCLKRQFTIEQVQGATVWFYDYLQALVVLTESIWHQLSMRKENLIKILHYVTNLIQQAGVEFKLLFINILCKIANTDIYEGNIDDFKAAFTRLYRSEDIVRNKLLITLNDTHNNLDRILGKFGDHALCDSWSKIKDSETEPKVTDYKYAHKCLETLIESNPSVSEPKKESSGNFEFADSVDNLFRNDSDLEESVCKKAKLDSSEAQEVIKRLEKETALLRTMKENHFSADCRTRIQNVCDQLNSIIN